MKIPLLDSQLEFYNSTEKFVYLCGGFGSGKSLVLVLMALKMAAINYGVNSLFIAPTWKMLQSPIIELFEDLCGQLDIPFIHHETKSYMEMPLTHNRIYLRSAQEPKRFRGLTVGSFFIEECSLCSFQTYKIALGRLRHPSAKQLRGFISGTPDFYDDYFDTFVTNATSHHRIIRASTRDNHFLDPEYVQSLEEDYDELDQMRFIEGQHCESRTGRAYYSFGEHNVVDNLPIAPNTPISLTCDFNISPLSWAICQVFPNRVNVLHEVVIPDNASTERQMLSVLDWYKRVFMNERRKIGQGGVMEVVIYGDSSGRARSLVGDSSYLIIKEMLRERGIPYDYRVPLSNPFVTDRLNSINRCLKDRGSETRILIDRSCKTLIQDLRQQKLKKDGSLDSQGGRFGHIGDSLGYLVYAVMPIRKKSRPFRSLPWKTV